MKNWKHDSTLKIIDHGRRIRACLKQAESTPISMIEQIAVLLALTANLFDEISLDAMNEAELAVRVAAADVPAEVSARLASAGKLTDEDRNAILQPVRDALTLFTPSKELKEIT